MLKIFLNLLKLFTLAEFLDSIKILIFYSAIIIYTCIIKDEMIKEEISNLLFITYIKYIRVRIKDLKNLIKYLDISFILIKR
ncbi:hypothetical protein [Enterobacteriaceae endosymbiont of Donacia semicuprea]|uniref:hypothetical protein n=1 Tax=Enterobacteriaceae endosymbiont of Donacia semicuprea TaxID=2675783 RepID=UPI001449DCB1|nr:hypothetical protein [Enterobacteriaceae endosymbiont of Donacia semicuprea]QJC32714.1 hypothetical protein GJT91_00080 [Enterobacteriaceae endosymbiont of Donacia semicuprea]